MKEIIIIQGSLNPVSKTAVVLEEVRNILNTKNIENSLIDLRKINLEFCDSRKLEKYNSDLQNAYETMKKASGYIIGMPVYCYSVPGPLKNFLDITCSAMENKFAGIVCNAGGIMSYLASAELMKILSYEVHVLTVQPTVYSWGGDFEESKIKNIKVIHKINDMINNLMSVIR